MLVHGFDWDDGNRVKITAHGLTPEQVEAILTGPIRVAPDPAHSGAETRYRAVGRLGPGGRFAFIVFTVRERDGKRRLRPISARFMHAKEVRRYEETHS